METLRLQTAEWEEAELAARLLLEEKEREERGKIAPEPCGLLQEDISLSQCSMASKQGQAIGTFQDMGGG